MVLQSSGAISFSQIRTEMNNGATGAMSISSYRANNNSTNAYGVSGVPTSGALSMSVYRGKTATPVTSGLIAKYTGESWTGSQWTDETGTGNNVTSTGGTIANSSTVNSKKYLTGGTTSWLTWPAAVLPTTYTLFHITRYNGTNKGRIFEGVANINWISGFHLGRTGCVYHGDATGWITPLTDYYTNTWIMITDQNNPGLARTNFFDRTTNNAAGSTANLTINRGMYSYTSGTETSDWACACVLVYNRALSAAEILQVENYLMGIYGLPLLNAYNYYSVMTKTPGSNYTMVQGMSDPSVQLQLTSVSVGGTQTGIYMSNASLQNYTSVVIHFDVYITTDSVADGLCFYMGGTNYSITEVIPSNGYAVSLQVWTGDGLTRGIHLINNSGTRVVTPASTLALCNGTWTTVQITYTKGTTNTWLVSYGGTNYVTYSDPNNTSWLGVAGSYYGFGARTGGSTGSFYIRRFSVTFQN
jgi:hypothetical protein